MISVFDWATTRFPDGGWFVEAGAHDGVGDSQTLSLERAGWQGLCVEPSRAFNALRMKRGCKVSNMVLAERGGEVVTFREMRGEAVELSGIVEHFGDHWDRETRPHDDQERGTVSLTDLLAFHGAPPVIELLCLDTEGSELAILAGHDFERFRFHLIQVEHNGVQEKADGLLKLLSERGYERVGTDGINDRYRFIEVR